MYSCLGTIQFFVGYLSTREGTVEIAAGIVVLFAQIYGGTLERELFPKVRTLLLNSIRLFENLPIRVRR